MNGLAIGGADEETLPTLDELNAQGNETKTEDLPSLAQLNAETTDKTTDAPKEATPESLPSIASLNGEEPAPSDSSAGELPSLAQLNGEEKPAEPPKENIGILETMRREKNAELGTDMGGWETAAHYTPVVGKVLDANEMRKENVAKRLAMGEVKDPLEIVRLARTIDIDPEKLQQVIDASDSGQRSIAGFRQAPNVEVLKKGVAELAMPLFKARIEAREKAQQSLENAEELNWAEKVGKGFLGTAGTVAEFATPVTMALGTAGNILTRGGAAAQDTYTLDENGNPVLVKKGDKSEGAVAKAILGGVAEQTIWSSPLVGSMLKAGGKAIMKAIPGAEKFVAGAAKKTLGSIGKAADALNSTTSGRLLLKTGEVLGKVDEKLHFGSLPNMILKTRLTEFVDGVVLAGMKDRSQDGLHPDEANFGDHLLAVSQETAEGFKTWLDNFTSVENNAELLTGIIGVHVAMAGASGIKAARANKKFRDPREALVKEYGVDEKTVKKLSNQDLDNLYRIVTSPALSADAVDAFLSKVKADKDAARQRMEKGETLDEVMTAWKESRSFSDAATAATEKVGAEMQKRKEISPELETALLKKAREYAQGQEGVAQMIVADVAARAKDLRPLTDPSLAPEARAEMLDALVGTSAKRFSGETHAAQIHGVKWQQKAPEQIGTMRKLGIKTVEDAEKEVLVTRNEYGRIEGRAARAVNVIANGSERLAKDVENHVVDVDLANEIMTAAKCEFGADKAARDAFIDGVLDRANGDAELARRMLERVEREGATAEGEALETRLDKIAEDCRADSIRARHPEASEGEAKEAGQTLVEQPDGTLKPLSQVVDGEPGAKTTSGTLAPETALEGAELAGRTRATRFKIGADGKFGCRAFPSMSIEISSEGVRIEGLTEKQMSDPDNAADVASVITQATRIAQRNGLKVQFPDSVSAEVAQSIYKLVREQGEVKARKFLDVRKGLLNLILKSELGNGITFDEESFVKALSETSNGRQFINNHGDIWGMVGADGAVHLNPKAINYNTPIHEYGHLALEMMKASHRQLWQRGMDLIRESEYYKSIKKQSETDGNEYQYLNGRDELIADEALATMIGDRGEKLVMERGVDAKLKAWIKEFWSAFKGALGIADLTPEQIESMTLEQFVDSVNAELLRGSKFGEAKRQAVTKESVRAYDEKSDASTGIYRWANDRGCLFQLPVDMERTRPGGKVYLENDDANITDWIQSALNGVELRMSEKGKIYVKGRNGLEGDLALVFGRYPQIGRNDGILTRLAEDTGHGEYAGMTDPTKLVDALLADREGYLEWKKSGGMDAETRYETERAEWEKKQAEDAARVRWEDSGMSVVDYVKSRVEVGDPAFDLDWETAKEIERMREQDALAEGDVISYEGEVPFSVRRNGEARMMVSQKEDADWRNAVDLFVAGKMPKRSDATVLPRVPTIMARVLKDYFDVDAAGKNIVISRECLDKATNGKHAIKPENLKRLPLTLDAPLAIFQSKTRPNDSITALVPIRDENGGISSVAAINYLAKDTQHRGQLRVSSVYGKTSASAVQEWIDHGYLRYVDRKNIARSFSHRLQLPGKTKTAHRFLDEKDFPQETVGIISYSDREAQGGGEGKFSVGRLYTGSAADYEKPSLHAVGTGEGSQVYGWGLYASNVRGVAEKYAKQTRKEREPEIRYKGETVVAEGKSVDRDALGIESAIRQTLEHPDATPTVESYYEKLIPALESKGSLYKPFAENAKREYARYRNEKGSWGVVYPQEHLYEQTFFTNRAPGDESHLLNWYEMDNLMPGNALHEQVKWIRRQAKKEGVKLPRDLGSYGSDVYETLVGALGSPKAASEFLARADIDGVKYPVDSYGGKGVKDGDKVGWNYVTFRDDNISVDHKWVNGEQKFHVGRVNVSELPGEDIIEFKPKVEMMDGTRVADAPENMGERSNYGLTASRELMNAKPTPLSQLGRINPMSLPVSEMLVLWKQMTGNVKGPAVKARLAGGATHGRDGELTIAADVFGIVDRTDMSAEKSRLKDHGFFQNEDPTWAATHTPLENRNEKSRSEEQLGHQLALLGERRVKGLEAGGQAAARGVFAHELAQVVMNMPRQPGVVGRVQKIGDGIRKAVAAQVRSAGTTGKENVEAKMRQEAGDFLDWAYGGPQTDPTSGQPVSRGQSLSMKQLTDATFGAFLTMPAEMKSRAPTWYDAVIDTIATTPKLAEAFRELSLRGVSRQAHGAVVEAVRKSMSRETQKRLAELKADIEEPISTGSLLSDAKETILVGLHDRMAPTVVRIDAKTKAYVKAKRAVIRQMKKQGAPAADIAAVEAEIERFTGNVRRKLNELEISRTAWERGAANEGLVYVDKMRELELEAGERWGLTQEDRSFYLNQMRVIETQGRAGARGESGAQAQAALGDLARRLGAEKWAHLQDYGRRFHAIIEQEVLNDPRVSEMLGEGFVNYMRSQAHYVTTKRVHSVEELDAIEQARADARAKGINGGDDVVKQMFDYADSLGGWDAKLVGSFSDTKEARSATWERHEQLMQATRRNHLVIQMRDALLAAGVEGVRDLPRTEKDVPQGSRYGLLNYVEGGVKKTLVVPRQIADGFKASPKSFATIMRVNEFCRKLMIDWNLGYAPVDASRNLGSIEKHMPGMHETPAKSLTRAVAPGAMGLTQIVAQSLAKRAKPLADGLGMLPGFKNSIYPFVGEAHEIVKYLQNPNDFQRKVWEARDTGDAAEEARLYRIQRTARQVLKANMFVSFAARTTGRATEGFANDFFNRHGMSIEDTPAAATKFEAIRKALMSKRNPFNANKTLIEYNDMFAKTVAYLHDRAVYGFQRSEAESGVTVKQNVGLGEVERRGRSSNTIQATINQFFNAVEKGMTQTARAIRDRPGETLAKCALSWTGRFVAGLAGTGVLAAAIRAMFDDDEEKIQASPLGDVYDYLQACERANRNLSAYTRENYNVTPLWNSPDGYTSVVLALPLDDQDRLFAWAADHAAGQVADKMKLNQVGPKRSLIGDASAATLKSMTPDLTFSTPVFNLLRLLFASANGENPRDNFRGAPMYDTNTWEMRGESLENDAQYLLETGKILWNQTGGRSFYNFGYNGVDPKAGEGGAPEWLGIAVNKIPIVSPVLKRFVKIQVGSAEKDALPVKEELKRIQATVTYCQRKLMQESASLDGALNERDPKRYAELLSKWKETYGLSDAAMRKIEVNFLNAWRDLENKDVKERKRTINVIKRGHKMGVEKADEFLRSGQL